MDGIKQSRKERFVVLGQGILMKILELEELAKIIGGPVEYVSARLEPKHTLADITKANKLLGWSPEIVFEHGLEELLK